MISWVARNQRLNRLREKRRKERKKKMMEPSQGGQVRFARTADSPGHYMHHTAVSRARCMLRACVDGPVAGSQPPSHARPCRYPRSRDAAGGTGQPRTPADACIYLSTYSVDREVPGPCRVENTVSVRDSHSAALEDRSRFAEPSPPLRCVALRCVALCCVAFGTGNPACIHTNGQRAYIHT